MHLREAVGKRTGETEEQLLTGQASHSGSLTGAPCPLSRPAWPCGLGLRECGVGLARPARDSAGTDGPPSALGTGHRPLPGRSSYTRACPHPGGLSRPQAPSPDGPEASDAAPGAAGFGQSPAGRAPLAQQLSAGQGTSRCPANPARRGRSHGWLVGTGAALSPEPGEVSSAPGGSGERPAH